MTTLVSARTYFVATCLVLGLVLVPYIGDLLYLPQGFEELPAKPVLLPEVAMLAPQEEVAPEEVVKPTDSTPLQHQSAPPPPTATTRERRDPEVQDTPPPQAAPEPSRQKEKEPAAVEPEKKEDVIKKQECRPEERVKEAKPAPVKAPSARERLNYKELVAVGLRLQREGVKSPGYRARMAPEVIEHLNANGSIRLGVTDGKRTYFFGGSLQQPGEGRFAMERDFRGWSTRYMQLDRLDGRNLLKAARGEFQGGAGRCEPVMFLRSDIDFMVLGSQERVATARGIGVEDLKFTIGHFRIYKGMPFNYSIEKIQLK